MQYQDIKNYLEQTNQMHLFSECKDADEISNLALKLLPEEFDDLQAILDFIILTDLKNHERNISESRRCYWLKIENMRGINLVRKYMS